MAHQYTRHRFTVEEFHKMGRAGVFSDDERVELLEGEILEMTPIGSRHAACVARLTASFVALKERCIIWVQNPVRLNTHSEPQPDLALLRPKADFYASALPQAEDTLLIIEVAETTAGTDQSVKLPLYAKAGIPEAWLVGLSEGIIEVFQQPALRGYERRGKVYRGERLAPQAFPNHTIPVAEILG